MTLTWPGIAGGGGQKYGLLNRGSAMLEQKQDSKHIKFHSVNTAKDHLFNIRAVLKIQTIYTIHKSSHCVFIHTVHSVQTVSETAVAGLGSVPSHATGRVRWIAVFKAANRHVSCYRKIIDDEVVWWKRITSSSHLLYSRHQMQLLMNTSQVLRYESQTLAL